jgi:hypothetical protein
MQMADVAHTLFPGKTKIAFDKQKHFIHREWQLPTKLTSYSHPVPENIQHTSLSHNSLFSRCVSQL